VTGAGGNLFEDFALGQVFDHATPRTLTQGDQAVYMALYGSRFAIHSSNEFAGQLGLRAAPIDDLLVFHTVFGKSVPDISLNAVANLGYADGRFLAPVYPGDTLAASSEVIGLKENSNGKTGVVYVRTTGINQSGAPVLEFTRWVMVPKRDPAAAISAANVPDLPARVDPVTFSPERLQISADGYDFMAAGSPRRWGDYEPGEMIDHVDGITVEEADHMSAARLYQNTARVHFNQHAQAQGRFKRRLVYGGHVISLARALSFNGFANGCVLAAVNGGTHAAPVFAGDTIFAWSEVVETEALEAARGLGAMRLVTYATRNLPAAGFPGRIDNGGAKKTFVDDVVLAFDYWVIMPR
jgi:2-methylfumaryl-CoA hydratase